MYKSPAEEQAELTRLEELREAALTDKKKMKELEKMLAEFAVLHHHHVKGRGCRFEVDALDNVLDILHGESLNIAKLLFKYAFLDGMLDEQREELAALSIEGGWTFDVRKKAKEGGSRDPDKKWMKASQGNVFVDGKSKARVEGADDEKTGGLVHNLIQLCDIRYLQGDKAQPVPLNPDTQKPAATSAAKPPAKPPAPPPMARPSKKQTAKPDGRSGSAIHQQPPATL